MRFQALIGLIFVSLTPEALTATNTNNKNPITVRKGSHNLREYASTAAGENKREGIEDGKVRTATILKELSHTYDNLPSKVRPPMPNVHGDPPMPDISHFDFLGQASDKDIGKLAGAAREVCRDIVWLEGKDEAQNETIKQTRKVAIAKFILAQNLDYSDAEDAKLTEAAKAVAVLFYLGGSGSSADCRVEESDSPSSGEKSIESFIRDMVTDSRPEDHSSFISDILTRADPYIYLLQDGLTLQKMLDSVAEWTATVKSDDDSGISPESVDQGSDEPAGSGNPEVSQPYGQVRDQIIALPIEGDSSSDTQISGKASTEHDVTPRSEPVDNGKVEETSPTGGNADNNEYLETLVKESDAELAKHTACKGSDSHSSSSSSSSFSRIECLDALSDPKKPMTGSRALLQILVGATAETSTEGVKKALLEPLAKAVMKYREVIENESQTEAPESADQDSLIEQAMNRLGAMRMTDLFMWVIYGEDEDMNLAAQSTIWRAPILQAVANGIGILSEDLGNSFSRLGTNLLKTWRGKEDTTESVLDEKSHQLYKWRNKLFHLLVKTFGIFGSRIIH